MSCCDSFFTETNKVNDRENRLKVRKIILFIFLAFSMSSYDMEIIPNELLHLL